MEEKPISGEEPFRMRHVNWWGLFLIALGVGWLGDKLGWYRFDWSIAGPLALILVGVGMVFGRRRRW
jgi:hypothetical protein